MKVYPKIPRYDHPVVPTDFFDREDLLLLEKIDGSSFRFTLYDEQYVNEYPEPVRAAAGGDGGLVFGTRKTVRGNHRDSLADIDGGLHRAVKCLREGIDTEAFRAVQDEVGAPVIVYAENLVYSTLDYGYTEQPIPALVGFDVLPYPAIDTMTSPANPYEETFDGFLDWDDARRIFERLRVQNTPAEEAFIPAPQIPLPQSGLAPDSFEFPESSLNPGVLVEGVVVRSDNAGRRVKLVRDEFKELNRQQFGANPEDTDSGAEYVVARYCTPARIRNQVRIMVLEEGREFGLHLNDDLYPRVVEDIWAENWQELMNLEIEFKPANIYPVSGETLYYRAPEDGDECGTQ